MMTVRRRALAVDLVPAATHRTTVGETIMSALDVVHEKLHRSHDPRWCGRVALADGQGALVCAACLVEMMERRDVSVSARPTTSLRHRKRSVRKAAALRGISALLKGRPGALRELLLRDYKVCQRLVDSLLGEDFPGAESDEFVQYVLDKIKTQLRDQTSMEGFLPTFNFLGKLLDSVPALPQSLATVHVTLLENLSMALLSPDEAVKSSVFYVFRKVWRCAGVSQVVPTSLRDRLCALLLHTLHHACSPQLIINCLGRTVGLSEKVERKSELKSRSAKELLLSGDETLQVASAQCIASIIVHSPSQYCPAFIHADIPEFLFERLCSRSEALLWSVYSCLLLLAEDVLFFSQCHSVYGIESLVHSLKEVLTLNNVEVQKQGLLLLATILERQPVGVGLFPSGPSFAGAVEALLGGIASPCLRVAIQAASTATALLRLNHQSNPVQYKELKKLVWAVIDKCTELPLPTTAYRRAAVSLLAEECTGHPELVENAYTAPDQKSQDDTLESFCLHLLQCCDTVCIPTITRHCERAPSASILQFFFSILSSQFSLLPSLMPHFSTKLDHEESEELIRQCLPSLCIHPSQWPSLLREVLGPRDSGSAVTRLRTTQYCMLILLHLALRHGDRLLPDATVFSGTVFVLRSVQEQGDDPPPLCVRRAALYLLSVTQDQSPTLDRSTLSCISQIMSCPPGFLSLYTHHSALLYFIFHYPELADSFGPSALELWLTNGSYISPVQGAGSKTEVLQSSEPNQDSDVTVLLCLLEKNMAAVLTLLGIMCTRESQLAHRALGVLREFLRGHPRCNASVSDHLRPRLLQVLQRLAVESSEVSGEPKLLSMVLQLLCLIKTSNDANTEMDSVDFKLLFHVSNLTGKLKPSNAESLLPAFNYLYCCLSLSPAHCADRASSLKLLQTLLDLDFQSPLLTLTSGLTAQRPLENEEAALHPLGFHRARCLLVALQGLLLQKQEFLLSMSVSCMGSLLGFLYRRSSLTGAVPLSFRQNTSFVSNFVAGQHVVCQPWNRFLLYSLLGSEESSFLHPAILALFTLLVRYGGENVLSEADLGQLLDVVEKKGVKELGGSEAQALKQLLTEMQGNCCCWLSVELIGRAQALLDSLKSLPVD
ncbi:Meiosis inhibitor protein 1-like, partial [Scleropages formosus]